MRLIDADAMHKFVEDKVAEGKDGWANGVPYEWAYALTAVDSQPTIDAVPVVHARWIDGEEDFCMGWISCSACDYLQTKYDHEGNLNDFKYCPHCGARMDAEEG